MMFLRSLAALMLAAWLMATIGCDQSTLVSAPTTAPPATAASQPLPSDAELAERIDHTVEAVRNRHLDPAVNNAWQIVHGLLAYGYDLQLSVDGKLVPAMQYALDGGPIDGWQFAPGPKGLDSVLEPGSKVGQGHEDQWIGYLSQADVPLDSEIKVKGETFHVRDLLTQAQWDVHDRMEATWTLMALATYLPSDTTWTARDGNQWSIEGLVGMEANADIGSSACGGSHRLFALANALQRHVAAGGKITGGWKAAQDKIITAIADAHAYQQPDGGFSVDYFTRSASSADIDRRINTTGHVFEFLVAVLDDQTLAEPWMTRAAVFLCDQLELAKDLPLECGGLYHAAHGLKLYRERRFGKPEQAPGVQAPGSARPAAPPVAG